MHSSFQQAMCGSTYSRQIDEQRRSLDENGLRYLISLRLFYIINQRQTAEQKSNGTNTSSETLGVRHRIRYRDIVWASFSQSQEILLGASTEACGGKMLWKDARALGVFLWLHSSESLVRNLKVLRNYISDLTRLALHTFRKRRWKSSPGISIWLGTIEILQNAVCCISLWEKCDLSMGSGSKRVGIRNSKSC